MGDLDLYVFEFSISKVHLQGHFTDNSSNRFQIKGPSKRNLFTSTLKTFKSWPFPSPLSNSYESYWFIKERSVWILMTDKYQLKDRRTYISHIKMNLSIVICYFSSCIIKVWYYDIILADSTPTPTTPSTSGKITIPKNLIINPVRNIHYENLLGLKKLVADLRSLIMSKSQRAYTAITMQLKCIMNISLVIF